MLLKNLLQNKPVIVNFLRLFNDSSQVKNFLLNESNLPRNVIEALLNSSINMKLIEIMKKSPKNIKDILCNSTSFSQYIYWPQNKESLKNATDIICANFTSISSGLKVYLDLLTIAKLSLVNQNFNVDLPLLANISKTMSDLLENVQRLLRLERLLHSFDLAHLSNLIPEIQRLAVDNVPEKIVAGVAQIINDLKVIENKTLPKEMIDDLNIMMKGILGLRAVQKFMALSAVFKDFLKSPDIVLQYLMKDLKLPKNISRALMDSTVSLAQFIQMQSSSFSKLLCFNLDEVLTLPNNTNVTYEEISKHLCNLDPDVVKNLTQLVMEQLKIGELVKQYVLLQAKVILKNSNMTVPDAKNSITSVAKTSSLIQKMSNSLNSTDVYKIFSRYLNSDTVDLNAYAELLPLICGRNSSLNFSDQYNLIKVSSENQIKGPDGLTDMQRLEITSLPNEFCRQLYTDIIKTQLGEIMWKFLKPLIRGKILFTPDNDATRTIIDKIDEVFKVVSRLQEMGDQLKRALAGVSNMKFKTSSMADLTKYLNTPFVQDMMKDMFEVDTTELMSGIEMLRHLKYNTLDRLQYLLVNAINYMSCMSSSRSLAVDSNELEKYAYKLSKTNEFLAAVIFQNIPDDALNHRNKRDTSAQLPKHVKYEIRMDIDNVPFTGKLRERYWRPQPEDSFVKDMLYFRGFIQLQDMIDKAIIESQIEAHGVNFSLPGVKLKQFPFPCHMADDYLHILTSYLMPLMMTVAWMASLALGIHNFVRDRQGGQEAALLAMGMSTTVNWLAWMVSTMFIMSLVCIMIVCILKFSTIFSYSNPIIMFLYFFIYCLSTTMMCYMVSSFFINPTLAVLTGLIIYLFSYMPYVLLEALSVKNSLYRLICCLSSTSAFSYSSLYLSTYEEQLIGIQWYNINKSPIEGDWMNFGHSCLMMLIDSALYFIIGWYVKNIKKNKYSIPKPWNFPFSLKYWGCKKSSSINYQATSANSSLYASQEMLLEPPLDVTNVGISLTNLTKRYGSHAVVNNLSLDFFKGEITTLLGQNGAGKTTTFNMMTGIMEATSGEVNYCDSERNSCKSWFGICPQQNILFDYMTAEEHIRLYATIKAGLTGKNLEREVRRVLKDVDLLHMRDVQTKQLSGGMQRRLCVALAFAGKSKIVILDEPTAGVDPNARRGIWDLILKYRAGCTVILSTHHLDEADILSDRIGILHKGKLLCSGSSLFLKRHLGKGYHLTLIKNAPDKEDSTDTRTPTSGDFILSKASSFIKHYIPDSELSENFTLEATYNLPVDYNREQFALFFENLENNLTNLGVKSYGISDTTLEDVFMKARDLSDAGIALTADNMKGKKINFLNPDDDQHLEMDNLGDITASSSDFHLDIPKKSPSILEGIAALLTKRAYHYYRNWRTGISFVLLPCLFFAFAIGFSKISSVPLYKVLQLSPELYGENTYTFYKNEPNDPYGNRLRNSFSQNPGIGTCCMLDAKEKYKKICVPAENRFHRPHYSSELVNKSESCTCENYRYDCPEYASGIPPPEMLLNSSLILQDLNSKKRSVVDYLLDSYPQFIKKRYGGWTYDRDENGKRAVTVWFNNKGHHALPAFLNSYSNAILRMAVNDRNLGNPSEYGITLFNNPIKLSVDIRSEESILQHASETAVSLVILLAFSFIPAALCVYLIKEHRSTEKYLFYINGIRPFTYWISAFLWDILAYLIPLSVSIIILAIFKLESFWARQNFAAAALLLFMFGWSAIPFMYTMVSSFKDTTSGYMIIFCINVFIGMSTSICVFLLSLFQGTQALHTAYIVCKYVFLVFPQFCMSYGIVSLANNQLKTDIYKHFGMDVYENPFSMLIWHFVAMAISGVVFFIITLVLEAKNIFPRKSSSKVNFSQPFKEDEDVQYERMRAEKNYAEGEDAISVVRLTKIYRKSLEKILAVKQISFGVKHGECFGLLGVNGAGKTTTFKMLTGEIESSSGDVYMFGKSMSNNFKSARDSMGYCPQENALDNYLTGRELLSFHSKIRGISKNNQDSISQLISELHLESFVDKRVSSYSGGMKRKLCLAIALLGDPPLVLLDEPTAGMDPGARRLVWNCINRALRKGQSVILTSHSMEECDTLCSRLCIMVNGEFKCLGSPQHLKNKFSKGYTVRLNLDHANMDITEIAQFMRTHFPGTALKESHNTTLVFSIPKSMTQVSMLFALLERNKENLCIKDYAISQTTLDMVFVGFAKEQSDGIMDKYDNIESICEESGYAYDNMVFQNGSLMIDNISLKADSLKYLETSHL